MHLSTQTPVRGVCVAAFVAALLSLGGCAPKNYEVKMAPQQTTTEAFVIAQYTKSGSMKLWDCREVPEGKAWNPTCVRIEMKNSMREDAPEDSGK